MAIRFFETRRRRPTSVMHGRPAPPAMTPRRLYRRAALQVVLAVVFASAAVAVPVTIRGLMAISGESPLPDGCGRWHSLDPTEGGLGPTSAQDDSEVEPHIAVNPVERDNIVAAWIQDRKASGGGGRSNVVAVTFDGGESWRTVLVPGLTDCTGGALSRATDPWLAFGSDGVVYLASLTFEETEPSRVVVNTSRDGGLTWSDPHPVTPEPSVFNDKEQISTHPNIPGRAYMTWAERAPFNAEVSSSLMFSTTSDHGVTWSMPRRLMTLGAFIIPAPAEVLVLPDDSLLVVSQITNFGDSRLPDGVPRVPMKIVAQRSTDNGETWSLPVEIATRHRSFPTDPDGSGNVIVGGMLIDVAIAENGTAYVVWSDQDSKPPRIALASSDDGGATWSPPRTVVSGPSPFILPQVAVGHRGTVGVSYLDFRNDVAQDDDGDGSDDELTTDARFSYSHDGGHVWEEKDVIGSFDMRQTPSNVGDLGYFLGDYSGLTARTGDGAGGIETFLAVIPVAPPLAQHGPSDIWFVELGIPPGAIPAPPMGERAAQ